MLHYPLSGIYQRINADCQDKIAVLQFALIPAA
jgi:hypothetical protein